MAIDELIELIKPLKWKVNQFQRIRCANGDCPIVAAARLKNISPIRDGYGLLNEHAAIYAEKLGISPSDSYPIIPAADNNAIGWPVAVELRERFIKELVNR